MDAINVIKQQIDVAQQNLFDVRVKEQLIEADIVLLYEKLKSMEAFPPRLPGTKIRWDDNEGNYCVAVSTKKGFLEVKRCFDGLVNYHKIYYECEKDWRKTFINGDFHITPYMTNKMRCTIPLAQGTDVEKFMELTNRFVDGKFYIQNGLHTVEIFLYSSASTDGIHMYTDTGIIFDNFKQFTNQFSNVFQLIVNYKGTPYNLSQLI